MNPKRAAEVFSFQFSVFRVRPALKSQTAAAANAAKLPRYPATPPWPYAVESVARRRWLRGCLAASCGLLGFTVCPASSVPPPAAAAATVSKPPAIMREFRGMWIASKDNIDWPSEPGLSARQQQAQLRELFDAAVQMRMNAVILQVRPQCDALYDSTLEPWSEALTGRQGIPPTPRWDPLDYAVREAHLRGLELHAWVNPFRARSDGSRSPLSRAHVSVQHPEFTVRYGNQVWLDPGLPAARDHSFKVIIDIVQRYDIDALHMDDYFYPYPLAQQVFPDERSYGRYRHGGGRMGRPAWRRSNVDTFVQQLSTLIHQRKPWVKFGISPFGIWRPGHPTGIRGLDAYETLSADAVKWLRSGWVDYLAPQLYWTIDRREQSYAALLPWWAQQNSLGRHLWPGLDATRIGQDRKASEIERQIQLARRDKAVGGVILWSATVLKANRQGIRTTLGQSTFAQAALIPASPWLAESPPAAPKIKGAIEADGGRVSVKWIAGEGSPSRRFALQYRVGRQWFTELLPAHLQTRTFDRRLRQALPDEVVLTPIGRTGLAGPAARWQR